MSQPVKSTASLATPKTQAPGGLVDRKGGGGAKEETQDFLSGSCYSSRLSDGIADL